MRDKVWVEILRLRSPGIWTGSECWGRVVTVTSRSLRPSSCWPSRWKVRKRNCGPIHSLRAGPMCVTISTWLSHRSSLSSSPQHVCKQIKIGARLWSDINKFHISNISFLQVYEFIPEFLVCSAGMDGLMNSINLRGIMWYNELKLCNRTINGTSRNFAMAAEDRKALILTRILFLLHA